MLIKTKINNTILIICFLFLIFVNQGFGQTDTEFWFVAPEVTYDHNPPGGEPVFYNITTGDLASTVTIKQPANPDFPDTTFNIPANTTQKVNLTHLLSEVENTYDNIDGVDFKSNKGFHITASSPVTIYYESSNPNNPDIFALKGNNSLGTEFYTAFQTSMYNQTSSSWTVQAYSSFDVVATQDNTQLTISSPDIPIFNRGTGTFTVNLDKGEVFSATPEMRTEPPNGWQPADIVGRAAEDHLSGVKVTTGGNKVAITLKDDSMKSLLGGCYDLAGDQTIPADVIGTAYIAMKGKLDEDGSTIQERVFIVSTQDNDSIWINNVFVDTQDEGDTYVHELTTNYTHIRTKSPSYVLQISGFGCEMGEAILPPIAKNGIEVCTGSTTVSFSRSTSQGFYLNLMVRKDAEDAFLMNGAPTPLIQPGDFTAVPGSDNWLAARLGPFTTGEVPVNVQSTISNTEDVFHLGIINGSQTGGTRFGYFSDFNEIEVQAFNVATGSKLYKGCFGDTVQVVSTGGTDYEWNPKTYIDDAYTSNPKVWPPSTTQYTVIVSGACNLKDSASVTVSISDPVNAYFNVDKTTVCAPVEIDISADIEKAQEVRWFLGNKNVFWNFPDTVSFDTTFSNTYNNNTDTAQEHEITMIVYNIDDCTDTLKRTITIHPEVTSDFDVSDSIGCHPLKVNYTNQSSGNIDSSKFNWSFGDQGSTSNINPSHTFNNYTDDDTVYTTRLIATSPYYCRDTIEKDITVHPFIETSFSLDSTSGCANFNARLKNNSSLTDTFFLDFGDGHDTLMTSWNQLSHNYINNDTTPISHDIKLIGKNEEGCYDSTIRTANIYPRVNAAFTSNHTEGCDSIKVLFTNQSDGHDLNYSWDFGDGSSSLLENPEHLYVNKDSSAKAYIVQLSALSPNFCTDTTYDTITVHPYIRAQFTVDTVFGCHPFNVGITNKSITASNYLWDFGDGNQSTRSDSVFSHLYNNTSFTEDSSYTIKLVVSTTGGCADSLSRNITVYHDIEADFYPDTTRSCSPAEFNFTNQSQGEKYYLWNFDNGATSVIANPTQTYERNHDDTARAYQVSLLVIDSINSCTALKDTIIYVNPYNRAEFDIPDYIDCTPFTTTLTNSSIGKTNTYQWYIDSIAEGSAPSNKDPFTYSFANNGDTTRQYQILLEAINDEGCSSYYTDTLAVYPKVKADFLRSDTAGCSPLTVELTNQSRNANHYYWDLGDESSNTDTTSSFDHTYTNLSNTKDTTFTIELRVNSDNCSDTVKKDMLVYASPKAKIDASPSIGCPPLDVTIQNKSEVTSANFYWDFDDGDKDTTSTLANVNHQYINDDTLTHNFRIKLHIETSGSCTDSATTNIQVYPLVTADFEMDSAWGCGQELDIQFTNQSQNAFLYYWDFDNGNTSFTDDQITQTFYNIHKDDSINYNVELIAKSINECTDTINKEVIMYPLPDADFSVSPLDQVFTDSAVVTFENKTSYRETWNYQWYFNDSTNPTGSTTSDSIFSYTYFMWGDKNNSYLLYDTLIAYYPPRPECRTMHIEPIVIRHPEPEAEIEQLDSTGCQPLTLTFQANFLNNYYDSIFWYFDDESDVVINESTVEHTFQDAGTYNVKLKVVGEGGTVWYFRIVRVYRKPIADFEVEPKVLLLPNASIQVFNQSIYAEDYAWWFGDEPAFQEAPTATSPEPTHTYSDSGTYSVRLIVSTDRHCKDTLVKPDLIWVDDPGRADAPTGFKPSKEGPTGGYFNESDALQSRIFMPVLEGVQEDNYVFQIFNRWGELIFETNDKNQGWDGYYNDKLCKMDVYIWKIQGKYLNGQSFEKVGTVTLLQ